ncbi:MAG: hypothetical protein RL417_2040, partial [Pseudomonadota bacterium]
MKCLSPLGLKISSAILVGAIVAGCGGGGGGEGGGGDSRGGSTGADFGCSGGCSNLNLTADDVRTIIANGVQGAESLGTAATFAVVDRVGNVLAVYQMAGAPQGANINGQIGAAGGLEGLTVPAALAAISKAGTGAYLSSQGNAFSTRTASQIIQENFNPQERNQPGGPLSGVQFSQLPCGDVVVHNSGAGGSGRVRAGGLVGPRPLPLGLSADPGGIPLYKNGDLVGGVGVEFDSLYTVDRVITDFDDDPEERVALLASRGFEAPSERTASNMSVGGKALRYTDLGYGDLGALAAPVASLDPAGFVRVGGFTTGAVRDGAVFGDPSSGVAKTVRGGLAAAILVDGGGNNRFPPQNGTGLGGAELKGNEVDAILNSALLTAFRARAAIRRPLDDAARVSIWVIDHTGRPLGFIRSEDAPVFGIDVSLQKARTAVVFSRPNAAAQLAAAGLGGYLAAAQGLLGGDAFSNGRAFANRSVGNLARPFFTDGINGNSNGPLSLPFPGTGAGESWSPFNTGLQLDYALGGLVAALSGGSPSSCGNTGVFGAAAGNGLQIFPGSVPLYRGTTLIGALGVSGDGIDQDDFIAFYGASRKGLDFAGNTGVGDPVYGFNAPIEIRADAFELLVPGTRL